MAIDFLGYRCTACRKRMYYGWVVWPPQRRLRAQQARDGMINPQWGTPRDAYHPECLPAEMKAERDAYLAERLAARNARRRARRAAAAKAVKKN